MRRSIPFLFALSTLPFLAGCTDLLTGGELVRVGESTGVIEVINASSYELVAVLISDCNNSSYGLNRLPDGATIQRGQSYTFVVSSGCWDVDAGRYGAEARQRMTVRAGGGVRYTVTD